MKQTWFKDAFPECVILLSYISHIQNDCRFYSILIANLLNSLESPNFYITFLFQVWAIKVQMIIHWYEDLLK